MSHSFLHKLELRFGKYDGLVSMAIDDFLLQI